jgi:hypothetical protein
MFDRRVFYQYGSKCKRTSVLEDCFEKYSISHIQLEKKDFSPSI